MSTRSTIGIENEDGTVSSVYCHWDGYPSYNGKILVDHYQDRKKVKSLIDLGDISSLSREVFPSSKEHSFENPEVGVTVAYHRDRGEEKINPALYESRDSYFEIDPESWIEYHYLFTLQGEWVVKPVYENTGIRPVNEVLAEET
jgi:hypothetical protein